MFWLKGLFNYPQPIIMLYSFRTPFPLFAVPSVLLGSPVGNRVLRMAISWLSWNLLVHGLGKFPYPVFVLVILVSHTVIWWLVKLPLFAAVVRFAPRFPITWLNALLILCPIIGFLPFLTFFLLSESPNLALRHFSHFWVCQALCLIFNAALSSAAI